MKNLSDLVKSWIRKADNDILNAEIILTSEKTYKPYDTVCFHCQQATEKYLKSFLIFNKLKFPKTHILEDLITICEKIDGSFGKYLDKVADLTDYAVEIRYPEQTYFPSLSETKTAFQIANEIRDFVLSKMQLDQDK